MSDAMNRLLRGIETCECRFGGGHPVRRIFRTVLLDNLREIPYALDEADSIAAF
jgi:hypothetical protein